MKSIREMMKLDERKVVVVGGAGNLALAAEEVFLELGARMALLDLDRNQCEERAQLMNRQREGAAIAVPCDLSDEKDSREALRKAAESLGGIDIVVHCAAWVGATQAEGWAVPFEKQTVSAWDRAMRVNVTSAFFLVQEALPWLRKSESASIVLVSSIYGHVGPQMAMYAGTGVTNPTGYGATKGAIGQLTRYLATQLSPKIRVNCISPGGIDRGLSKEFVKKYEERTPLGRMANDEDFKGAVAFLASDLSGYVTGHDLLVDGGWTAW